MPQADSTSENIVLNERSHAQKLYILLHLSYGIFRTSKSCVVHFQSMKLEGVDDYTAL